MTPQIVSEVKHSTDFAVETFICADGNNIFFTTIFVCNRTREAKMMLHSLLYLKYCTVHFSYVNISDMIRSEVRPVLYGVKFLIPCVLYLGLQ
jgi:hypothetical protein